jgi:hypothetical protein
MGKPRAIIGDLKENPSVLDHRQVLAELTDLFDEAASV